MSNSKQQRPCEHENYPISPEIIYYSDWKFTYIIVQENIYPSATQLRYTGALNYFPVPDYYIIKTTWGQSSNSQTIQYSIYYIEGEPHYLIYFRDNL